MPIPTGGSGVTSTSSRPLYGHDSEYAWLRGKLEYSSTERCWRLRYIPADGQADQYGGSVVLGDTRLLAGFERGDFVEVCGKFSPPEAGSAAQYAVAQIKKLSS